MSIPYSRSTTYLAGVSQVKADDLNALQDGLGAINTRTIHFGAGSFDLQGNGLNGPEEWSNYGQNGAARYVSTPNGAGRACQIDLTPHLMPGQKIKEILCRWRNGATPTAGSVSFSVAWSAIGAPGVTVGSATSGAQTTNTGAALLARSHTIAVGHVVLADHHYGANFSMDATADADQVGFAGISVVLEDPAP